MLKSLGQKRLRFWVLAFGLLAGGIFITATIVLVLKWPFTRKKVAEDLAQATATTVEIGGFSETYFPPGCVAENVIFRRDQRQPPLLTVKKLILKSSLLGLFRKHLTLMQAEGARVVMPAPGTGSPSQKRSSDVVIDLLVADQAVLEFRSQDPARDSLKFDLHRFRIHELGGKDAMPFEAAVTLPEPRGEASFRGRLGPWQSNDFAGTRISGAYTLRSADLAFLHGVAGWLSSDGKFSGSFSKLEVEGTTDAPDFEVTHSGHKQRLATRFHAFVDTRNGDVSLQEVDARWGASNILGRGIIAAQPVGKGKSAHLDFISEDGRIQDLLFPFIREPHAPLNGPISFDAHVDIGPEPRPFLDKVVLKGEFGITHARFTNPKTQQNVDQGSARARGEKIHDEDEDPQRVLSDLTGNVLLKDGRAVFSRLAFRVPGAVATMSGSFDLRTEAVNLHGILRIQTTPAEATSGFKSFLVKIVSPFVKKDHPNAPLPVSITGTYHRPHYDVSLGSGKDREKERRHTAKK